MRVARAAPLPAVLLHSKALTLLMAALPTPTLNQLTAPAGAGFNTSGGESAMISGTPVEPGVGVPNSFTSKGENSGRSLASCG